MIHKSMSALQEFLSKDQDFLQFIKTFEGTNLEEEADYIYIFLEDDTFKDKARQIFEYVCDMYQTSESTAFEFAHRVMQWWKK